DATLRRRVNATALPARAARGLRQAPGAAAIARRITLQRRPVRQIRLQHPPRERRVAMPPHARRRTLDGTLRVARRTVDASVPTVDCRRRDRIQRALQRLRNGRETRTAAHLRSRSVDAWCAQTLHVVEERLLLRARRRTADTSRRRDRARVARRADHV